MRKGFAMLLTFMILLTGFAVAEETDDASSLSVQLKENPTTGYTWTVAVGDGDVLAVIDNGYTASGLEEADGGVHSWTIAGIGKGKPACISC